MAIRTTPATAAASTVQTVLDIVDVSLRRVRTARVVAGSGLSRSDETDLVGEDHDLHAVAQAELGEDAADVGLDGRLGEHELRGDLGVRASARELSASTSRSRAVSAPRAAS